jgi:uncharacterized Zn finger protein
VFAASAEQALLRIDNVFSTVVDKVLASDAKSRPSVKMFAGSQQSTFLRQRINYIAKKFWVSVKSYAVWKYNRIKY